VGLKLPQAKKEIPVMWVLIPFIIAFTLMELGYLWGGEVDYALHIAYYQPSYGFPMPYGILWTWMNPFWWTSFEYKVFITGVVLGMTTLETYLFTKGKIPVSIVFWNIVQNIVWFLVGGYQHVTTTAFQALSFWNPFFMFGWVFQEFPIGNPAGWQCDFGPKTLFYTLKGYQWQLCGPGDLVLGRLLWHIMEITWCIVPMMYWSHKTWKAHKTIGWKGAVKLWLKL
jgi:hypothetical protein